MVSSMERLLAKNVSVIFNLDLPVAEEAAKKLILEIEAEGGKAYYEAMDGTKETDWAAVVADVLEKEGRIDVLVNNAGINIRKAVEEMSMEEWMKMMEVNIGGVFL